MFAYFFIFPYFQPIYVVELKVRVVFFHQQLIHRSLFFEVYSAYLYLLINVCRHSRLMQLLVCWHLALPYCFLFLLAVVPLFPFSCIPVGYP